MKICAKCHDKDKKVTGCILGEYAHHAVVWAKCEICGIYAPISDCIHYNKLKYKKIGV